jgi:GntR family transcriptional regulator/MocR family aminotransferase
LAEARATTDGHEPLPNQLVLREFIDHGHYSAHQRRLRDLYRERRTAMEAALRPYLGTLFEERLNPCGLHLLLRPKRHPADEIADALRSAGIACTTLAELTRGIPGEDGLLLGFAAFSPDVIEASRPALDGVLAKFT